MKPLLIIVLLASSAQLLASPCLAQTSVDDLEAEYRKLLAELYAGRKAEARRTEPIATMEGDPRVRVSESTLEPKFLEASKAVGRLRVENEEIVKKEGKEVVVATPAIGSCVLVSPNVAITSAHAYDSERSPSSVQFGYRDGRSLHETRVAKVAYHDMEIDIAVIVLEDPVPADLARPAMVAPKAYDQHFPYTRDEEEGGYFQTQWRMDVVAVGYSADDTIGRNGERLTADVGCGIGVSTTHGNALGHSGCIWYPGASGGGVFLEEDGDVVLIGIIRGGNGEYEFIEDRSGDFINKDVFEERVRTIILAHAPKGSK